MKTTISILVAILMLTSSCKFIKEKGWFGKSKADTMAVWLARQDSIRAVEARQAELENERMREQARIDSIQAAEQAQLEWESRFKYHIIVGGFITPEYADDYLAYYRSMGFDAEIIDGPDKRFQLISAERHNDRNRAIRRLYQYQDTVDFESWLYIYE
ncbi:MAG: hypothetical protein KFF49_05035 [Bacteroidales bacterium]|nr:hypothetical protein [Bacteroidales bacterium]